MVERSLEGFCQVLRVAVGLLVAALIIPVTMQVIARYTGIIPVYLWTEELATFLFVWLIMIGSTVAVWEGTHFDVHVTPLSSSPLPRLLQKGFVIVVMGIFALLFAYFGIGYAQFGALQTSMMLQVNLLIINITVPFSGFCWTIICAFRLWQLIQEYKLSTRTEL